MRIFPTHILLALTLLCGPAMAQDFTWIAPPARGQLERDPTLIPKGKGFLFVPTMTSALNEPSFRVFQGKKAIAEASPGTGMLLSPGYYEVLIGTGTDAHEVIVIGETQEAKEFHRVGVLARSGARGDRAADFQVEGQQVPDEGRTTRDSVGHHFVDIQIGDRIRVADQSAQVGTHAKAVGKGVVESDHWFDANRFSLKPVSVSGG